MRSRVLTAAVLLAVVPLLVWLVSRTVRLPFGPGAGEAEAVGPADLAVMVVGCAAALPDLLGDVTGPATTDTVPDHGHDEGG